MERNDNLAYLRAKEKINEILDEYPSLKLDVMNRSYCEFVLKSRKIAVMNEMEAKLGFPAEVGELMSLYQKAYRYGEPPAREDLISEFGDVFYYFVALMKREGFHLREIIDYNINKICDRNPDNEELQAYRNLMKK
jgi:hypothetical protein